MNKNEVIKRISPTILKGIAHRGLHNEEFTENGLRAFQNAIDHHLAFELDVHLTTDNELVVMHDYDLLRTTGKPGVMEKLTLKDIKDNYRLLDGEEVPSFKEILSLDHEQVPIIVELKVYDDNYQTLTSEVKKELSVIKDKSNIMIIGFDPRAMLKMKNSGFVGSLLVTTRKKQNKTYSLRHLFESLDLDVLFFSQKRVQHYSKHHFINVWTIDSKEKYDEVLPYVDTVTFENMDYEYVVKGLSDKNKEYLK